MGGGVGGGWGGWGWKIKTCWKYGVGAGLLKRGREAGTFLIQFFQTLSFLPLEITLPFAKLYYAFEEKNFFSCHHNFMKKDQSKLPKNGPENIP